MALEVIVKEGAAIQVNVAAGARGPAGAGLPTSGVVGDTLYYSGPGIVSLLPGNSSPTRKFLAESGDGTVPNSISWEAISGPGIFPAGTYGAPALIQFVIDADGNVVSIGNYTNQPNIPTSNVVWVAKNGSDDSAQRGNLIFPFLTLGAAKTASASGDTIDVLPGTYDENNLAKSGVNWNLDAGVLVNYTGGSTTAIFDDTAGAITSLVAGEGQFTTPGQNTPVASITNSGSIFTLKCDTINGGITHHAGIMSIEARQLLVANDDTAGIWWRTGESTHVIDRVIQGATSNGVYLIWLEAFVATTGQFYLKSNLIQCLSASESTVIAMSGDKASTRCWIEALQIDNVGTSDACRTIAMASAGKFYVTAQKIFGQVFTDGSETGELHIHADKIEARTIQPLFLFGGDITSFIEIGYAVNNTSGSLAEVDNGTTTITGMKFFGGSSCAGIQINGGTLRLVNCAIDTSANASTSPITITGGTLILDNCTLVAQSAADSIAAATAQTVINYGSRANRAKNANVTVAVQPLLVDTAVQ